MEVDFTEIFYYDPSSPTGLRYLVGNSATSSTARRVADDVAGCFCKRTNGKKSRITVKIGLKAYGVHRIIWQLFNGPIPNKLVIDHKDGDPWNNKIENLRMVPQRINTKNREDIGKSSGIVGVSFYRYKGELKYVVAHVRENGENKLKYFSIAKYGFDKALELAKQAREKYLQNDPEFSIRHISNLYKEI